MPKITAEEYYGAADKRINRLGLSPLFEELKEIVTGFPLLVKEEVDANGGKAVRKMLDTSFKARTGWIKGRAGAIDWTKCVSTNGGRACIGVEVQVSARSDLIFRDIVHARKAITEGEIDVVVLIVPDDRFGQFLTDRAPRISDARRIIEEVRAEDTPLVLIGIAHDGVGPPLTKQRKSKS